VRSRSRWRPLVLALVSSWGCAPAAPVADAGTARSSTPTPPQRSCVEAAPDAPASFPDPHLQTAVRRALGLSVFETLTCGAVRALTSLHAPDARISDLTGIEVLESLEELYIYGNNSIRDVSPLVGLKSLRDLNLARNEIEDIGPLAELRSLTSLSLYGNPIRDIGPLANLTGLTRLRVEHTAGVSDLSALRGLHNLTRLELSGNEIVDLSALAGLNGLTRLSLQDNVGLSDIGPLAHLRQLEILMLGGTAVTDLRPLAPLSRLSALGLEGTPVRDLGVLIGLTQISQIDLRDNPGLTDIQPLLFNASLGRGDAVRLERTGVRCEDIAALRVKGVSVLAGC
jgi:Leucine-rich repeat (LRR) protein